MNILTYQSTRAYAYIHGAELGVWGGGGGGGGARKSVRDSHRPIL